MVALKGFVEYASLQNKHHEKPSKLLIGVACRFSLEGNLLTLRAGRKPLVGLRGAS